MTYTPEPHTDSRTSKPNRIVWLVVLVIAMLVAVAEWQWIPAAWDIVSYAQSYAQGHVQASGWSLYDYIALVAASYLSNFGPLVGLGMLPLLAARVLTGWRR